MFKAANKYQAFFLAEAAEVVLRTITVSNIFIFLSITISLLIGRK